MSKIKKIKQLFGNYIDKKTIDSIVKECTKKSVSNIEKRIIIAISNRNSQDLFSLGLYNHVVEELIENKVWIIESLAPIPFISAPSDTVDKNIFLELLECLHKSDYPLRIVAAVGEVEYGLIGRSVRMAYGSSGKIVSIVIQAVVNLPYEFSWYDKGICELISLPYGLSSNVAGIQFYKKD